MKSEDSDIEIRDKGEWERELSELPPTKGRKRVNRFGQLSNGLTPQKIMYGEDYNNDDFDILRKSLE